MDRRQPLTSNELAQLIAFGREQRGVEFKGPGFCSRTKDPILFARIVRAILGMSNRQDGGMVIVGVEETDSALNPVGLSGEQLSSWQYDALADRVFEYADPMPEFDLELVTLKDKNIAVIRVTEFLDIPVLCKRDFNDSKGRLLLRSGACYVRPRRKPETIEVGNHQDMRDLIDLATQKRLRWLMGQLRGAGVSLESLPGPTANDQFDQQASELLGEL